MVDVKLSFLVKKISKEVGVKEYTDKSVDILYKNLSFQNREYQRRNVSQLKDSIASCLQDMVSVIYYIVVNDY